MTFKKRYRMIDSLCVYAPAQYSISRKQQERFIYNPAT